MIRHFVKLLLVTLALAAFAAGCGRYPDAPETSASAKPNPIRMRSTGTKVSALPTPRQVVNIP